MTLPATVAPPGGFDQQVDDANLLLQHAVTQGKVIGDDDIATILGAGRSRALSSADSVAFAKSYRKLAETMGSVTAQTLRATSDAHGQDGRSDAKRWSRSLWWFTIVFALAVLLAENYKAILDTFFARDEYTSGGLLLWHGVNVVLQTLVPFMLGGLGAATYLLRSAHVHLHARTFDPNFIPEYRNRLLLGVVAGGTIGLLIDVVTQDGAIIDLSAGALAFVAGYNADLLFSTIERLSEALLPKVGVETMRRAPAPHVGGTSIPALIQQLDEAKTPEAKETIQGLIAKVRERM